MKKYILSLLSVVIFIVLVSSACTRSAGYRRNQDYANSDLNSDQSSISNTLQRYGAPKRKIFILPFYNETPHGKDGSENYGQYIANELIRNIQTAGMVIIPKDAQTVAVSQDFYVGSKIRLSTLVRECKKLGVGLIVVGRITRIIYRQKGDEIGLLRGKKSVAAVDAEMRMFDCSEGKESLFDERSADSSTNQVNLFGGEVDSDTASQRDDLIKEAMRNAVTDFNKNINRAVEKMGWRGRIAKISSGKVYINAGRATGLNIGDILKVMTEGDDVYDPITNAYMGRTPGQPKGTIEIVDFLGPDASVGVLHSGGGFIENDVVQLY